MNDQVPQWLTYEFPPAVKAKVNRLWGGGEWHGQAQKWSVMFFRLPFYPYNLLVYWTKFTYWPYVQLSCWSGMCSGLVFIVSWWKWWMRNESRTFQPPSVIEHMLRVGVSSRGAQSLYSPHCFLLFQLTLASLVSGSFPCPVSVILLFTCLCPFCWFCMLYQFVLI